MVNFYPPPYERTVWYYEKANTELIRRAIDQFNSLRALSDVNVDEKVYFFTKILLSIIQNFIPHEIIICDDRNPPWINKEIKKLMVEKDLAFKWYCCSNKNMFLLGKSKAFQYIFSSSDIAKIISHLDSNKAHGHDMLSIPMIKLCGTQFTNHFQ